MRRGEVWWSSSPLPMGSGTGEDVDSRFQGMT
jgi:hypothetical protein